MKFDLHAKQFTASVDVDNSANSSHSRKLNPSMTVTWWYGPCYRHVDKCVSFYQYDPFYKHIFDSTALILLGCFQCFVLRSASMPNYRSPNYKDLALHLPSYIITGVTDTVSLRV